MRFILMLMVVAMSSAARAEVRIASLFTDHMVIQQQQPVPVWGTADAGEDILVSLAGREHRAAADQAGNWRVTFDAIGAADHPDPVMIIAKGARNEVAIRDVLVGEVWLCSGQSNMAWTVKLSGDAEAEIAAANYPGLRLAIVQESSGPEMRADANLRLRWTPCTPTSVAGFSAVGYYFGRQLHGELNVPVGLIHAAVNGTYIESWTSRSALEAAPSAGPIIERNDAAIAQYPELFPKYQEDIKVWLEKYHAAQAAGEQLKDPQPRLPLGPNSDTAVATLFNHMIHPLIPFAMRGVIWYQGESNVARACQYRDLLPTMIDDWRARWGHEHLHFGIVQLANIGQPTHQVTPDAWSELREAQAMTATQLPDCGLAVIIDIGEADNIHPKNKQDVGKRLALWAVGSAYGRPVEYSGPIYKDMSIEQGAARITFDHVGMGLIAHGDKIVGFSVAGENKSFIPAEAVIDGDAIVVRCEQVPAPVAVRYAWTSNPICNLYNVDGLPAAPFRTDAWPGRTINDR